jgi:hypothetical protein
LKWVDRAGAQRALDRTVDKYKRKVAAMPPVSL